MITRLIQWLSAHRWVLGMNPKGWSAGDEVGYQRWAATHEDWRSIYLFKPGWEALKSAAIKDGRDIQYLPYTSLDTWEITNKTLFLPDEGRGI